MASTGGKGSCPHSKCGLKPLNKENIMSYYIPAQGALSYTVLSLNVMNPKLITNHFPKTDITNLLLLNAAFGSGMYLYNRPHLSTLPKKERLLYSAFGATTFTLGSVLVWALIKSVGPSNLPLLSFLAVASGYGLLRTGYWYTNHLDSLVKK